MAIFEEDVHTSFYGVFSYLASVTVTKLYMFLGVAYCAFPIRDSYNGLPKPVLTRMLKIVIILLYCLGLHFSSKYYKSFIFVGKNSNIINDFWTYLSYNLYF